MAGVTVPGCSRRAGSGGSPAGVLVGGAADTGGTFPETLEDDDGVVGAIGAAGCVSPLIAPPTEGEGAAGAALVTTLGGKGVLVTGGAAGTAGVIPVPVTVPLIPTVCVLVVFMPPLKPIIASGRVSSKPPAS